ncbi:5' nucleotidase, NT5C type [Brenneria tiliae]|uniref:5' nucleotidase, NT5C type n=1 Tax=Brenneria tiliae TaxID=2914984 RepID=UPI002014849A|nr:5'-3'-deoxyribonucleotidase [Brenneria tiliae]MCL2898420.1 5'-3'-deoxyribonucleotidase [Brenneria tiliae]MCL2903038.1 5'-3'-deoxyribonucleotidase [Brenneria tiliae]
MARIAVDMDEVIADFNVKMVAAFNRRFAETLTLEQLSGHTIQQLRPDLREEIDRMIGEPEFFSDLPVIRGSQEILRQLVVKHDVFITTAAMEFPLSFNAKFCWLREHFPFVDPLHIVFCGYKGILQADYLIDDNARHFMNFTGEGILFSAPHNIHLTGYRRVDSWEDVAGLFL